MRHPGKPGIDHGDGFWREKDWNYLRSLCADEMINGRKRNLLHYLKYVQCVKDPKYSEQALGISNFLPDHTSFQSLNH